MVVVSGIRSDDHPAPRPLLRLRREHRGAPGTASRSAPRARRTLASDGRFVMGGAVGDPPHGALIVLRVDDPAQVEEFVAVDPYVVNGLVTAHRVEPWAVVD